MRLLTVATLVFLAPTVLVWAQNVSTPVPTNSSPGGTLSSPAASTPGSTSASASSASSDSLSQSSLPSSSATVSSTSSVTTSSADSTPTGCESATFSTTTDFFPDKVTTDKINGFDVVYNKFYKLVNNYKTGETWIVYCSATKPNTTFTTKGAIQVPLKGSIAAVDMSIIGYLDLLGLGSQIKYVGDSNNITSPCVTSASSISGTPPDDVAVVFQPDPAPNLPTYVTTSSIDDTLTPLQKAQWINYFAALTNTEAQANQVIQQITSAYNCHQKNIAQSSITMTRNITFVAYDASAQAWTFPNTTFHNQLALDAGARLQLPSQLKLFDSAALQGGLQNTSLLIDMTPFSAPPSYNAWLSQTGYDPSKFSSEVQVAVDSAKSANRPYVNPFGAPPFLVHNRLYRPDLTSNSHNVWDYTSRVAARPDLVLFDLILAQFPSYAPSKTRTFLRLLSPNSTESPHAASFSCPPSPTADDSCSSHTITDTQDDNALLSQSAPGSLSLTAKVIIGVVGGMVGLAILSAVLVKVRRSLKDRGIAAGRTGGWKGVKGEDDDVEMVPEGRF